MYKSTVVLLLALILHAKGFNIETQKNVLTFTLSGNGANTSYFGYSVSLQYTQGKNQLVASAPRYNGTGNSEGAVFHCEINDLNRCEEVSLNSSRGYTGGEKGFSLSLSGSTERTLACAPLYHRLGGAYQRFKGMCAVLDKNLTVLHDNIPCLRRGDEQGSYGFCQAGFDSAASRVGNMFVVGIPGAFNYKGGVSILLEGKNFVTGNPEEEAVSTLMGYSVTWGNFSGNRHGDIATGAPRADTLKGKVFVMSVKADLTFVTRLEISQATADGQMGSFFGAAVCAVDLNNDGKDDLLVGAPLYSKNQNEGRVYVYMNNAVPFSGFDRQNVLDGDSTLNAQFGMTIVNLGDMNDDKFSDVAIGAPFGGPDGNGIVYLYNGGRNGIRTQYTQIIRSPEAGRIGPGFGYAVSTGFDVDNNQYPDIAIGSYSIGAVYVFRTRAVVSLSDNLETDVEAVPQEEASSNCDGPDGKKYYCIRFSVNLRDGGGKSPESYEVEVTMQFDTKRSFGNKQRALVFDPVTNTSTSLWKRNVTMMRGQVNPVHQDVYVKIGVDAQGISPIDIATSYKISSNCSSGLCPILDINGVSSGNLRVPYLVQCSNAVCKTDLAILDAKLNVAEKRIVYGVTSTFSVDMLVGNFGEPAYQAMMKMNYSTDFKVDSVTVDGKTRVVTEKDVDDPAVRELSFIVSSPLKKDANSSVIVTFSVNNVRPSVTLYVFDMLLTSPFGEDNITTNNNYQVSINTQIETCLNVVGDFSPLKLEYNPAKPKPKVGANVSDIGPEVKYTFTIYNNGLLDVENLIVNIETMTKTENVDFLYIVDLTANGLRCNDKVNAENYNIPTKQTPGEGGIDVVQNDVATRRRQRRSIDACGTSDAPTCKTVLPCTVTRINKFTNTKVVLTARIRAERTGKMKTDLGGLVANASIEYGGPQKDLKYPRPVESCLMTYSVTTVVPQKLLLSTSEKVQWWWILLAIVAALIALAIVCAILYRVGFFKRNRDFSKQYEADQHQELEQTDTFKGIDPEDISE
ncbi:integrin alpha-V-like isoform X1 [Hydractinia symbiolongicarpus]|uniref:integrin alpha-V-like isoform X1 n=1 Tax=Hydractinia symbiolongicarpus TaxID=13093 RepID=UPI002551A129|nr:integrin alpha-V-like isoform X1 [Hydractinia symbiolongicarpus]